MTRRYHANNFSTTLATTIGAASTSIVLTSATGLPAIGSGETYSLTLKSGSKREIVIVTDDASSPTLTVTRAAEGTTAQLFVAGADITLNLTADSIDRKQDKIATAGDVINYGEADSFEVPNSATPTVNADGEIALDTTVADWSHGLLKYYGGEELFLVALPIAAATTPTNGYVVAYNATNDEFELVAQSGGGGGSGEATALAVNQAGHGLSVGNVIKMTGTGSSNTYSKAQADSVANAVAVGIVSVVTDVDNFTYVSGGYISGLSGLTTDVVYYLSPSTAGLLTSTEPTTAGQVSKSMLVATSTTAGIILNGRGNLIPTYTGTGNTVLATSPTLVTPALGTPASGTLSNCTGLPVAGGGTGVASNTAYAILCGGTTGTGAQQSIASVGTLNQALYSNGAGALPTFKSVPMFRAKATTAHACGAGAYTKAQLDSETFDTASCFDNATNYRHTPTTAGYYLYIGQASLSAVADTKQVGCVFYKNGASIQFTGLYNGATGGLQTPGSVLVYMNGSSDYMELYIWNGDTASRNQQNTATFESFLAGIWVGA